MTPQELRSLHDALCTDEADACDTAPPVLKLIEGLNAKDPALLSGASHMIQSEVRPINELRNIFRNASRGYHDSASRAVESARVWLSTYLVSLPLISRLELADPTCRFDVAQGAYVAKEFLQYADIKTPTDNEANASFIISYIIGQSRAGLIHGPATSEESMAESIKYISLNLPEVELLIPELKKRCAFDKGTIEILLGSATASMRNGEL